MRRLETPGREIGSQETLFWESVKAEEIFWVMVDGVSVIRMRERGEGADLDILEDGVVRDIMRFVGAGEIVSQE